MIGFTPIFDGKTLDGWHAPNMSYWSVEDGAITAQSTDANPCDVNQFLVWQGGDVADNYPVRVYSTGCTRRAYTSSCTPAGF